MNIAEFLLPGMQAVILAAGRGTRMGELTEAVPKPLLKVIGRPIVEYTLLNLPEEISEIIFVIGYKGEMIKKYFGNGYNGKKIIYTEQKELNGSGGAIWAAKELLHNRFLVLNGDDLYDKRDLEKMCRHDLAVLALKMDRPPQNLGVLKFDEGGYIIGIIESPKDLPSYVANTGTYTLNADFFNYPLVPKTAGHKEFGLPQTLMQMVDKNKIKVEWAKFWHPNTKGGDLVEAEEVVKKYFKL